MENGISVGNINVLEEVVNILENGVDVNLDVEVGGIFDLKESESMLSNFMFGITSTVEHGKISLNL